MIANLNERIHQLIWGNRLTKAGAAGRALVVVLRFLYAMARDFSSGQLTMRAMSLVYTTLLSVVPLLAFSFAILKAFGVFNQFEPYITEIFVAQLGEQGARIAETLLTLVENVKGSVLGGAGLLFLLWYAISTVQKVEESFNYTWYVARPRDFYRRVSEYLVVLLVGPIVMVIAIGMLTTIQSNSVVQWVLTNDALGPLFVFAGKAVPYLLVSGVFTFLYIFLPNTVVNFKSAVVGGIAGGFMWATVGAVFTNFILYASRTLQIYAGFAVAITTLIWLYLNWLILLIGAQLAFYHQRPAFLRTGRQEPRLSNAMRERVALNIMYFIGQAFRDGAEKITASEISERINIPTIALAPIISSMEHAGLVRTTDHEELVPGREMARIRLSDILDVVRAGGETGSHRSPQWSDTIKGLGGALDDAISGVIGDRSLADLLDDTETERS